LYLFELSVGQVGFGRPDLVELSFGRAVAHSFCTVDDWGP
jgi:hypothetical protein